MRRLGAIRWQPRDHNGTAELCGGHKGPRRARGVQSSRGRGCFCRSIWGARRSGAVACGDPCGRSSVSNHAAHRAEVCQQAASRRGTVGELDTFCGTCGKPAAAASHRALEGGSGVPTTARSTKSTAAFASAPGFACGRAARGLRTLSTSPNTSRTRPERSPRWVATADRIVSVVSSGVISNRKFSDFGGDGLITICMAPCEGVALGLRADF